MRILLSLFITITVFQFSDAQREKPIGETTPFQPVDFEILWNPDMTNFNADKTNRLPIPHAIPFL
jgi:hypothetical protein